VTPAAAAEAVASGFTVLVATGGGLGAVALGILLAPVLGAVYAIVVDRVHRLHRVLGGGLSRIAVTIVLQRWEQLDDERVVLVDGELKRLAPPSR
jgi:hypothetical protein